MQNGIIIYSDSSISVPPLIKQGQLQSYKLCSSSCSSCLCSIYKETLQGIIGSGNAQIQIREFLRERYNGWEWNCDWWKWQNWAFLAIRSWHKYKVSSQTTSSWRLNIKEFCLPQQNVDDDDHHHSTFPQLSRASMPSVLHSHRLVFLLLSNKLFLT